MSDVKKTGANTVTKIILGFILTIIIVIALNLVTSSLKKSSSEVSCAPQNGEKTEVTKIVKPQPVLKKFLLKPGCEPYVIKTNNRPIEWDGYRAGTEGQEVVLIRFKLISGELTPWMNITGKKFSISELPDNRSTTEVHFGVPREGSSQGMEVALL